MFGWTLLASLLSGACGDPKPPPGPAGPRIVALSPAVAIILRDLGYQKQIVGRHASDLILDESVSICGDQNQIDYEALIGARPTHVFTQWGTRNLPERLASLAADKNWTLRECSLLSLDDIERETHELDVALSGKPEGTPQGNATIARLRESLKKHPRFPGVGRVLLLGGLGPPSAFGPGSWHHQILERLGAKPAVTKGAAWQDLSLEDVRALAPDAIVVVLPRSPRTPSLAGRELPTLGDDAIAMLGAVSRLDIPAIKYKRVAVIDDPLALTPSTSLTGFADELGSALSAWSR
ncbi:hypothetical protein PHYC_03864 [Phycisphaerales bacterium]|nr:hypothetical protein PHYC_03864 [Phycisphaerales bacterium]